MANAFWNHELEQELREKGWEDFKFFTPEDRETAMEKIDAVRAVTVYEHHDCTEVCRQKGTIIILANMICAMLHRVGCGKLFAMDGNWKLCYPICMFEVQKYVSGFDGALKYVDSCPNQPVPGMAFCNNHCKKADSLSIPSKLREFLQYLKKNNGTIEFPVSQGPVF